MVIMVMVMEHTFLGSSRDGKLLFIDALVVIKPTFLGTGGDDSGDGGGDGAYLFRHTSPVGAPN